MQLTRAGRGFGSFRRQPAPRTLRSAQPPLGFPARPPRRGTAHRRRGDVHNGPEIIHIANFYFPVIKFSQYFCVFSGF